MKKNYRDAERGGAGVKLLIVLVVLFLLGHAGFNYIPVAYQGESFKQDMHTALVNGVALPGIKKTRVDSVRDRLKLAVRANDLPDDTFIEVKQVDKTVQAHVMYSKDVEVLPFGLYTKQYEFNHVATPTGFLTKE